MTDRKQDIVGRGMLEKVARAIAVNDGYSEGELDRMAGDERVDPMPTYRMNARAALMAMRDVSDELADVGADYGGECYGQEVPCMRRAWTAMIDAILAESDTPCPTPAHTVGREPNAH